MFVFPHLFAEVMDLYMKTHGVSEEDLAQIAVIEYGNASYNPYAQMQKVQITLEQAMKIEGINRYVVEGLPLKTYDCSQITDGYAALILATEEGLAKLGMAKADMRRDRRLRAGHRPAARRRAATSFEPAGAYAAMNNAYAMAGVKPADVNVAEVHDCFTVMAAIAAEVLGKARVRQGRAVLERRQGRRSAASAPINTSGGLIAKGHPIGATGVAMIGWCAWQLLGKVPAELQVEEARRSRPHSTSAARSARRCALC